MFTSFLLHVVVATRLCTHTHKYLYIYRFDALGISSGFICARLDWAHYANLKLCSSCARLCFDGQSTRATVFRSNNNNKQQPLVTVGVAAQITGAAQFNCNVNISWAAFKVIVRPHQRFICVLNWFFVNFYELQRENKKGLHPCSPHQTCLTISQMRHMCAASQQGTEAWKYFPNIFPYI